MTTEALQLHERINDALDSGSAEQLSAVLKDVRAADIAEVMDLLDDEKRSRLIYALPPRVTAEVVVQLDEAVRSEVVEDIDERKLGEIVTEMPPDDAADVMAELPLEQFDGVIERISQEKSDQISELLTYEKASAGGIMNPRIVRMSAGATVGQAIEEVRRFAADEDIHFVYVVDENDRLVGTVPLRKLVVYPPETVISDLQEPNPVTVQVDDDQEQVLQVMRKYDIAAVPVLDNRKHLVGRVTYDDVMDVAEEEAAEDIYRMAGTDSAELETHSSFRAARVRLAWLIPCMIGSTMAGWAIASFRDSGLSLTTFTALILFNPLIAATSGNAGIQVSAIILRGFATGELVATRLWLAFAREIRIALFVGILSAVLAFALSFGILAVLKAYGSDSASADDVQPVLIGLAAGLGMLCAITESVLLGIGLPFLFRKIGVDPAIASGPLITSFNDLISVSIYLAIALWIVT